MWLLLLASTMVAAQGLYKIAVLPPLEGRVLEQDFDRGKIPIPSAFPSAFSAGLGVGGQASPHTTCFLQRNMSQEFTFGELYRAREFQSDAGVSARSDFLDLSPRTAIPSGVLARLLRVAAREVYRGQFVSLQAVNDISGKLCLVHIDRGSTWLAGLNASTTQVGCAEFNSSGSLDAKSVSDLLIASKCRPCDEDGRKLLSRTKELILGDLRDRKQPINRGFTIQLDHPKISAVTCIEESSTTYRPIDINMDRAILERAGVSINRK